MLEKRLEEWARRQREKAWQEGFQQGLQEARQKSRQEGRQEGEAELLMAMLEQKFGPLDEVDRMRIRSAHSECLLDWGRRLVEAQRLSEILGD